MTGWKQTLGNDIITNPQFSVILISLFLVFNKWPSLHITEHSKECCMLLFSSTSLFLFILETPLCQFVSSKFYSHLYVKLQRCKIYLSACVLFHTHKMVKGTYSWAYVGIYLLRTCMSGCVSLGEGTGFNFFFKLQTKPSYFKRKGIRMKIVGVPKERSRKKGEGCREMRERQTCQQQQQQVRISWRSKIDLNGREY